MLRDWLKNWSYSYNIYFNIKLELGLTCHKDGQMENWLHDLMEIKVYRVMSVGVFSLFDAKYLLHVKQQRSSMLNSEP